jgi:integrase
VAMAGWLEWRLAAGIASTSLKTQCWHLVHAADALSHIDPLEVTYSDLIRHMASTAEWSPDARRQHRSTIRGFYKWCVLTEQLSKDPAYNLPSIKAPIGEPNPVPDDLIAEALARASWSPKLRAMILLAACCGLRRAEIATLRTSNIQGAELRVTGKGRRVRMVPMPDLVIQALMALEADPAGYVFPGETSKGHIGVEWVGDAISNALPPPWTAHKLRHRFATAAYDVERDLLAVQRLLGHTSPATTQIYTRVRNDARRRAVDGAAEAFA